MIPRELGFDFWLCDSNWPCRPTAFRCKILARIHAVAAPGGICISERVYEDVRNKPEMRLKDLGEKRLKNVTRSIRVYALVAAKLPEQPHAERTTQSTGRPLAAGAGALLLAALF